LAKVRADQLIVERGLAESRSKAQALIMAGKVLAGGRPVAKPGETLDPALDLSLKGHDDGYVSRGAHKLLRGLDHFSIDVEGLVAIDVGASTGGFTDVLLRRGAKRVHAVDVGYGQLDWRLRQDDRVVVMERTNARHLTADDIEATVDLVVCDASFISLTKVLPAALALTRPQARLVALIKPQFEAGRADVGKGGVVRDAAVHARVCHEIEAWLTGIGWRVLGVVESPIKGPKGNVEFLVAAVKD
jgi:23S rRNA (cytidine1920-2'-O)/16S rRNA (cytidine1409-2'-O)-methyltransferase